jgi:hypothetical protein
VTALLERIARALERSSDQLQLIADILSELVGERRPR